MVLSDLVINSPKSSNDELNPVRKEIYLGGNTLSSCGWAEWELGRNWQGSCLVLLWQNVQFCHVWERLTLQVSFFLPVLLKWVAGGPPADGLEGLNGNQNEQSGCETVMLGSAPQIRRLTILFSHLGDQYSVLCVRLCWESPAISGWWFAWLHIEIVALLSGNVLSSTGGKSPHLISNFAIFLTC